MISISDIRLDGGTQSRAQINDETVSEYADAMADPATVFPPVVVYYDGKSYWLADGFHRVAAWQRVGREEIPAEVRQGDKRAAILHSCGANAAHGLRRTNADKRRAVVTLLEDAEWSAWSDREIARKVRVDHKTVGRIRESLTGEFPSDEPRTFTTKHGTEAKMNTANIGGSKPDQEGTTSEPQQNKGEPGQDEPKNIAQSRPGQEPPEPPEPKPRNPWSGLTREALEDDATGLKSEVEDLRSELKAIKSERDQLKAANKDLAGGSDASRIIGKLQRENVSIKHARDEALAANKRMEYRLKKAEKERDEAVKSLHSQEIAL